MKRFVVVLLAGVVWCLCGCSGSADPPAQAVPTASVATSAPTPTGPVEPVMPAAARERSRAGAIAFTRYYWAVANYAQATLDPSQLVSLQEPECRLCTGGVRWIRSISNAGGAISGGVNEVAILEVFTPDPDKRTWLVAFRVRSAAGRIVHAGSLSRTFKAGATVGTFTLQHSDAGWRVTAWRSR